MKKINLLVFLVFFFLDTIQPRNLLTKAYLKPIVFLQQTPQKENTAKATSVHFY